MASDNFERCLAITLKWEGGYSNHPDDPGGPTMRGIIQREYDAWREKHGRRLRAVRQIEEEELLAIYRTEYWDAMGCENLPSGIRSLRLRRRGELRCRPRDTMAAGDPQPRHSGLL